jgi:hypothetical protein
MRHIYIAAYASIVIRFIRRMASKLAHTHPVCIPHLSPYYQGYILALRVLEPIGNGPLSSVYIVPIKTIPSVACKAIFETPVIVEVRNTVANRLCDAGFPISNDKVLPISNVYLQFKIQLTGTYTDKYQWTSFYEPIVTSVPGIPDSVLNRMVATAKKSLEEFGI